MFCGQCGNQVEDNSKFCGKCGANLMGISGANGTDSQLAYNGVGQYVPQNVGNYYNASGSSKFNISSLNKKVWIIVGSAISAIILLIIIIAVATGGNSVEGRWIAVGYYEDGEVVSFEDSIEKHKLSESDLKLVHSIYLDFNENGGFMITQGQDRGVGSWQKYDDKVVFEIEFTTQGVLDFQDGYLVCEPGFDRDYNGMVFEKD